MPLSTSPQGRASRPHLVHIAYHLSVALPCGIAFAQDNGELYGGDLEAEAEGLAFGVDEVKDVEQIAPSPLFPPLAWRYDDLQRPHTRRLAPH